MLRLALPPYRLPNEVVDDDVANVTDAGVKIVTDSRVEDLEALKAEGYDAVLLAIGTHQATKLRVPGEDLPGVMRAADFLKAAKLGEELDAQGQAGRGDRRRQRRHRRGPYRPAARRGPRSSWSASSRSRRCLPTPRRSRRRRRRASPSELLRSARASPARAACESVELMRCVAVFDDKGRFSPKYADGTRAA